MFYGAAGSGLELLVIAVVALVVIGPKELPGTLRTIAFWVRKARSMAREFQSGFEELTREAELEGSPLIRSKYPLLFDTASVIAHPQVRNMATVAGNLAHGDPANDHPATMLALGAQVVATSAAGERMIPIEEFFLSLLTTALKPGEILTEIRIPIPPQGSGGAYFKLERKVGDFATAAVAVQLTVDDKGACQKVGIGLPNVGMTPVKAAKAEAFHSGKKLDDAAIRQAAQLAADEADPTSDLRGPAEYKKGLVKELTQRALTRALERARK